MTLKVALNDYVTFRHSYLGEDPVLVTGRVDGPLVEWRSGTRSGTWYPITAHGENYQAAPGDIVSVRKRPRKVAPISEMLRQAGIPEDLYIDDVRSALPRYQVGSMQEAGLWTVGQLRDGGDAAGMRTVTAEEWAVVQDIIQGWAMGDWAPARDALVPPPLDEARIRSYAAQKAFHKRLPRALCPFCGGNPAMTVDDKVRHHKDLRKRGVTGQRPVCLGSGQTSAGLQAPAVSG